MSSGSGERARGVIEMKRAIRERELDSDTTCPLCAKKALLKFWDDTKKAMVYKHSRMVKSHHRKTGKVTQTYYCEYKEPA